MEGCSVEGGGEALIGGCVVVEVVMRWMMRAVRCGAVRCYVSLGTYMYTSLKHTAFVSPTDTSYFDRSWR